MSIRLSQARFAKLVDEALGLLPEEFRPYMENVVVEILPRPTRSLLREENLPAEYTDLLGLYQGIPLTEKSVSTPYEFPERIYIFQRNIEDICQSEDDVVKEVHDTVLHEVGHHFGMDEDDLTDLGYE